MLIGYDCPEVLVNEETRSEKGCSLYGVRTKLGWTFVGSPQFDQPERVVRHSYKTSVREIMHEDIVKAFDLDFSYPRPSEKKYSADDELFMKIVTEGIHQRPEGHFEMPLPMKEIPDDVPDNYGYALHCLLSVGRRMKKDTNFGRMYKESMQALLEHDFSEPVPEEDLKNLKKLCWYWSHHGVSHPLKPDVIRAVFNGSKKICGFAINNLLLAGPDLINSLVGVLLRFRTKVVPVTCDVAKMFLQVYVSVWYRDFLCYLWFKDGDLDKEVVAYRMQVHLFGATSSPGCANFALRETARRFGHKYSEEVVKFLEENFYVDNGLGGAEDGPAAENLVTDSRSLCAEGGFDLRKFRCGDTAVMEKIPKEIQAPKLQSITLAASLFESDKALGVELDFERDCFILRMIMKEYKNTRRSLLSCLSSMFDPMGLASPVLLKGRVILQKLCAKKFEWDMNIPADIMKECDERIAEMKDLGKIEITRKIRRTATGVLVKIEIHTFSDASCHGYGCCVYSLLEDKEGNVDVTLLYAKARVNPVKATTVPRLELQAAVLAVKCGQFMKDEIKINVTNSYYYTDSSVVLGHILNLVKRFMPYMMNRASLIRELTDTKQWRYIQTDRNPADIASQGIPAAQLASVVLPRLQSDIIASELVPLLQGDIIASELLRENIARKYDCIFMIMQFG